MRPDGKDFAYAASINFTDVIDVTDPTKPVLRERIRDPQLTISHQAEPNRPASRLHGAGHVTSPPRSPGQLLACRASAK